MRIAPRRALAAAAVIPALALPAACTSGDPGKKGEPERDQGGHSSAGSPAGEQSGSDGSDGSDSRAGSGSNSAPGGKGLTTAQLKKAALADGDVPGYQVAAPAADDAFSVEDTLEADKPQCQPVADVLGAKPRIPRTGSLNRNIIKQTSELHALLLSGYARGDAEKSLSELKAALDGCRGFKGKAGNGEVTRYTVKPVSAVSAGDDAAAFRLAQPGDAASGSFIVTVVRSGSSTAAYISMKLTGEATPVPARIATEQAKKLKSAAAPG